MMMMLVWITNRYSVNLVQAVVIVLLIKLIIIIVIKEGKAYGDDDVDYYNWHKSRTPSVDY